MVSLQSFKTLLLLDLDGERFGFTTEGGVSLRTGIPGEDNLIQFVPGLITVSLPSRSLDPISNSVSDGSSSVRVSLDEVPAIKSLMAGASIFRSRGRVYCWRGEPVLEDSVLAYSGALRSPRFDATNGEFEFVLELATQSINRPYPATIIGDEGRFVNPASNSIEEPMPIVYGRVKKMAIPTLFLDNETGEVTLCLAAHDVVGDPNDEGYVRVGTDEGGEYETRYKIQTAVDGLGTEYAFIVIDYSVWDDSIYVVDMIGKRRPGSPGGLARVGEVLVDIWSGSSPQAAEELDFQRTSFANERLNSYDISLGLNDASDDQTLIDILTGRLAGQFPVVFGSPNGLYGWDCLDIPPPNTPPIARLTYGYDVFDREALEIGDPASVLNRFRMSFGVNGQTEQNEKSITVGADNSEICRYSQGVFGPSAEETISASDVESEETAYRILQSRCLRSAVPRVSVSYSSLDPEFINYPLMSVVEVTDADLTWSKKRFLITEIRPLADVGRVFVSLMSADHVPY